MQGEERADRQLLDAAAVAGRLVPEGSMFAFLAGHRGEVFPDEDFADLFPSGRGRPSVPATQMAAAMTLQVLHDYSDRETAEAVRCDLRWKVALGLAVDDEGFDPSTLVYWRQRLARSGRPHRINEKVKAVVEETGILAGRRRRVVDSTLLADAVATQDTVTQLIAAVRRAGREVPGAAEKIAGVCTGHDYSRPRRPVIDWDDAAAREALVSGLVNDANAVVAAFAGADLDEVAASALALLALTAGQDVEPAEGSDGTDGRWRLAKDTATDRMISQADTQARHARKNQHTRVDGYRAHLAAGPCTGIITGEELTMAAGDDNSDAAAAARFLAREHAGESAAGSGTAPGAEADAGAGDAGAPSPGGPGKDDQEAACCDDRQRQLGWYADTAYGTGELRQAIAEAGDTAVIKPKTLRPPAAGPGGFTTDDFTPDEDAGTVTCPAGVTRRIPPGRVVTFGVACRGCPLRSQCTTNKAGRSLVLHPHDRLLRAARRDWAASKDLRKDYSTTRPHVERTVAQIATTRGRRIKLRYRGTAKNNAWLKRRTAAVNLRNLISKGLHHASGTWALAT